jgi:TonB family protein
MKKFLSHILILCLSLSFSHLYGQEESIDTDTSIFIKVQTPPQFPGGEDALFEYLKNNIQYTAIAKKNGTEGVVYVQFIVEKDGSQSQFKVLRGIKDSFNEEALRVLKLMPNWTPGMQRNVPVRVQYIVPVKFSLDETVPDEEVFVFVEELPEFPGGSEARLKFLQENLNYPQQAKEKGIQGTVYVKFVVEKDGSISDAKIIRGIGAGCDEEVLRVVKLMPKWKPGKQRGKAVRVYFNMPVKFTLTKEKKRKRKKKS